MTTINVCSFSFPTEIQLKRQERKRRSTCISPQNALDIDPEVSLTLFTSMYCDFVQFVNSVLGKVAGKKLGQKKTLIPACPSDKPL